MIFPILWWCASSHFGARQGMQHQLVNSNNTGKTPLEKELERLEKAAGGRRKIVSQKNSIASPDYAKNGILAGTRGQQALCLIDAVLGLAQPLHSQRGALSRSAFAGLLEDIPVCCTRDPRQFCLDLVNPAYTQLHRAVHDKSKQIGLQVVRSCMTKLIESAQTALRLAQQKTSARIRAMFSHCEGIRASSSTVVAVKRLRIQGDDELGIVCGPKQSKGIESSVSFLAPR